MKKVIMKALKWLRHLKPIEYIVLLAKYNRLSNNYNTLKEAISNKCFNVIFAQVTTPSVIKEKDRKIKKFRKQIKKQNEELEEKKLIIEEQEKIIKKLQRLSKNKKSGKNG